MNFRECTKNLLSLTLIATLVGCMSKPTVEKEVGEYKFIKYSQYKGEGNLDIGPMTKEVEKEYQDLLVIADSKGDIVNFKGDTPAATSSPEIVELVKLMSPSDKTKLYLIKLNGSLQIVPFAEPETH